MRFTSLHVAFCLLVPVLAAAGDLRAEQPQIQAAGINANEGSIGVAGNAGSADAFLTVTLTPAATGVVTVAYATEDLVATGGGSCGGSADYVSENGTVQFNPGQTSRPLGIALCGDTADEPNENFRVRFSNAVGATIQGQNPRITITDDDIAAAPLPTMSIGDLTVVEGDAGTTEARFPVTLSAESNVAIVSATVTISPTTATPGRLFGPCDPNVDVVPFNVGLTFLGTSTSQEAIVRICGDTVDEPDETFQVVLSDPFRATLADPVAIGTIIDDDAPAAPPTLSITRTVVILELTKAPAVFRVQLSRVTTQTVTVGFATAPGTASAGTSCVFLGSSDYLTRVGTLTFIPGTTRQNIEVPVCRNISPESPESFTVTLSSPVNATIASATGTATISE